MRRFFQFTPILMFFLAAPSGFGREARSEGSTAEEAHSCGTVALFCLLRFEGRGCSLDEVAASLTGRDPRGHSLSELREGAKRLGLDVEGVRLIHANESPERPMIAFLDRGGHGHFVAIRPIGHTGRLVQVIDGFAAPEVMDMRQLAREPGWTGLGLTSGEHRRMTRTLTILIISFTLILLGGIGAVKCLGRRQG